jgi:sugar O-acyltransferase (sialic acid O-acetyltransferase NeuD family)
MKPLVIVGAGGFAREVRDVADAVGIEVFGYIVDLKYGKPGDNIDGLTILGDLSYGWDDKGHAEHIIAIGEPVHRYKVWERHNRSGVRYATLIHPSTQMGRNNIVLMGSIICGGVIITNHVVIHPHTHINLGCTIGHDVNIKEFVTLSPGVHISGNAFIGVGTFIGTGAVVVERVNIGRWCHIGAGAVVTKDVPDNTTVVGVPGKIVRIREDNWQDG